MGWFGKRLYYSGKELQNDEALGVAGVKQNADLALVFDEDMPPPLVDARED